MLTRPSDEDLYAALIARDDAFEGQAWVGVTTTGVFCRLTCPARKPKRENTRFFSSLSACLSAGFRPCQRCEPLRPVGAIEPMVTDLVARLWTDPERRWCEADLRGLGLDPSTVRRAFKRRLGTTFLELARSVRLTTGVQVLAKGARVIDAQVTAGFESASGFRDAFAKKLGVAPGQLVESATIRAQWIPTPLGPMVAVANADGLVLLEFFDRQALSASLTRLRSTSNGQIGIGEFPAISRIRSELDDYYSGRRCRFETPRVVAGTPFSQTVWTALRSIPPGQTRSYRQIAEAIGRSTATRAVARANGANVLAIVIPCHRVLGADGALTGYGGGTWRKQWLIEHEHQYFRE